MPDYDGYMLAKLILSSKKSWKTSLMNAHKIGKHKART